MTDNAAYRELLIAGWAGLSGTQWLLEHCGERIAEYFPEAYRKEIEDACREGLVTEFPSDGKNIFRKMEEQGASDGKTEEPEAADEEILLREIGEGGIFAALWKMAEALRTGLSVDLRKIPVRQETIEVCECFDLHPYILESRGAYLLASPHGIETLEFLQRAGIPAALIGRTAEGNDRLIRIDDRIMYLTKPQPDELEKVRT